MNSAKVRAWYGKLLLLYPRAFREQLGESMEQTFSDLYRERRDTGKGLLGFVLQVFVETFAGIVREHLIGMTMRNKTRLFAWSTVLATILMIPLAMQFQPFADEVQWNEAVAYGLILLAAGGAYELWQWLKMRSKEYRVAFAVGGFGALLLGWINGAVGIIGSEDNPANLMYGAVFAVGLIGFLVSRSRPHGMMRTLFAAALVQVLVPIVALAISPDVNWGDAGVTSVFVFNSLFAMLFAASALLFLRAARKENHN